jgi:uncharacterized damage-inducible protein DinB
MAAPSLDTLRELMHHMEWADASVWRAVLVHPPAVQDPRVRDLLSHLHDVQRGLLAVWTGQPLTASVADAAARDLLTTLPDARAHYLDLQPAVEAFDDAALQRRIIMPGLEAYEQQLGRRFDKPTLAESVLHIASHSTYHRGQVNARLREVGGEPPLVDYIAWIWFGRPRPEWPAFEAYRTRMD